MNSLTIINNLDTLYIRFVLFVHIILIIGWPHIPPIHAIDSCGANFSKGKERRKNQILWQCMFTISDTLEGIRVLVRKTHSFYFTLMCWGVSI